MIRINANATYIVHARAGGFAAMISGQMFLDMLAQPSCNLTEADFHIQRAD